MILITETRVSFHLESLGNEPEKALQRIDKARGREWHVLEAHALGVGAGVIVSVPGRSVDIALENRIKTRLAAIVDDADVKAGYARLARKIGLLLVLVAATGFTGCKTLQPVRVTVAHKNIAVSVDLGVSR